jgi:hypothetical protein
VVSIVGIDTGEHVLWRHECESAHRGRSALVSQVTLLRPPHLDLRGEVVVGHCLLGLQQALGSDAPDLGVGDVGVPLALTCGGSSRSTGCSSATGLGTSSGRSSLLAEYSEWTNVHMSGVKWASKAGLLLFQDILQDAAVCHRTLSVNALARAIA